MKLVRTSLAALVVLTVYACSTDATAPEVKSSKPGSSAPRIGAPGGPLFSGTYVGSGTRSDSTHVAATDSASVELPDSASTPE